MIKCFLDVEEFLKLQKEILELRAKILPYLHIQKNFMENTMGVYLAT